MTRTNMPARRPVFKTPRKKGHWTENKLGRRQQLDGYLDESDRHENGKKAFIILPSHIASKYTGLSTEQGVGIDNDVSKEIEPEDGTKCSPQVTLGQHRPSQPSPLETLPNEILLQIFEPLVLTEGIYHISPATSDSHVSLHWIHTTPETSTTMPLSSLALISPRIRNLTYSIFYSRNQFVLELAPHPILSHILIDETLISRSQPHPTCATFHKTQLLFTSWSHLYKTPPQKNLSSPLTTNTIPHLTNLTLCASLTSLPCPEKERKNLKTQLHHIAKSLTGDHITKHALKKLILSLTILPSCAAGDIPMTSHLGIRATTRENLNRLEMFVKKPEVGIEMGGDVACENLEMRCIDDLFAAFSGVKGVERVVVKNLALEWDGLVALGNENLVKRRRIGC